MWYIHTTKYFLAVKRDEVLIYATTLMNLESIMLIKGSQTKTQTYYMILITQNAHHRHIYRDKN